jgi:hypothetical protein
VTVYSKASPLRIEFDCRVLGPLCGVTAIHVAALVFGVRNEPLERAGSSECVRRVFWTTRPSNTRVGFREGVCARVPRAGKNQAARCGKVSQKGFSGRRYYLPMAENYGPTNTLGVSPARPNFSSSSFESVLGAPNSRQCQLSGRTNGAWNWPGGSALYASAPDKLFPAQKCIRSCISEIRAPLVIRRVSAQIRIYYLPASPPRGDAAAVWN